MDPSDLMNNPQLMSLLQDPEVMQMLQEPGMMQNLQNMMSNPSAAMSDPRMMNLLQRVSGGMGNNNGFGSSLPSTSSASSGGDTLGEDMGNVITVSSSSQYNFKIKDAISKQQPIVVQFTMQGCRPCQMIKPHIIRLSKEYPNLLFLYVDHRRCPEIIEEQGISGFPTIVFFSTLNSQLVQLEKTVGYDLPSVEANVLRLNQDIEQRKKHALFKAYKHMPIRESEIILFKQIQWDKLQQKVDSLLKAENCPEIFYRPFKNSTNDLQDNFSTPAEMLVHLTDLIQFLQSFATNSMNPIKPVYIKVLNILFEWPQEHWSVPSHVLRMGAFHNDFAANIAKGGAKTTFTNLIQRVCTHGLEIDSAVNGVLIARALCSCFDKKILTKTVLTSIDDIIGLVSYLCLTFQDDNNVITSALALLLNTSYLIYCYAPSTPNNISKQAVMVDYQKTLLSNVIETLPLCIGETQPDAIYKLLIVLGTTFFPYYLMFKTSKDQGTIPPPTAIKAHFDSIGGSQQIKAWKETFHSNTNIQEIIKEFESLMVEIL